MFSDTLTAYEFINKSFLGLHSIAEHSHANNFWIGGLGAGLDKLRPSRAKRQ
jgi:hypothetical protein